MKSIKVLLLVLAVFCNHLLVFAQSWTPTTAPSWFWMSIACSADGSKVAAVAGAIVPGPICTSTDSGNTWVTNNVPFSFWSGIASSADGTKLVAIVYGGGIYTSTNSGTDWASNSVPNNSWQGVASSADAHTLAAVVDGGGIYFSTNGGNIWNPSDAAVKSWRGIASSADGTKMVAAALNDGVYLSTNSGANWVQTTGVPNESWDWGCASSSAKGDQLAVVSITHGANPSSYVSTNSGATWIPLTNVFAVAVASSADGNKLVSANSAEGISVSTNSGLTWELSYAMFNTNWQAVASSADGGKLYAAWGAFTPPASGFGGISILQTTQAPKMHIRPAGSDVTLSWIIPSTNFVLQQSADLVGSWTSLTNLPVLNQTNLQDEVTLPIGGAQSFYQLRTP